MLSLRLKNYLEKFTRFSFVGALVTSCSLGSQVVLLKWFHSPLIPTYIGVYGLSILLSYFLNSRFTFSADLSWRRMGLYYGVYLSSMGLGVLLLMLYRSILPFENWVLPLLVIPFTMTWNFILSSRFLKAPVPPPESP